MNIITKATLGTLVLAFISSDASADNQQQQMLLALQRANAEQSGATTVALFNAGRGVGQKTSPSAPSVSQFTLRQNQHGQTFGSFSASR